MSEIATVKIIAERVRALLGNDFPLATNGIWAAGDGRRVRRLGMALAGSAQVAEAACRQGVDALLLHRPWQLGPLPPDKGVLVFHEALDERLTTGENPWLAERLGFTLGAGIGERRERPLVSLAHSATALPLGEVMERVRAEGFDQGELWNPQPLDQPVHTIALANAMRPALVAMAASQGARLYLTGTLRPAAEPMLLQTEMAAMGLGAHPIERWGLDWLAATLHSLFRLEIVWLEHKAL